MQGTPFGRYRLIELLGRGGMGEVWRAYDTETKRIVAIKVLPPYLADDNEFVRRFRREAEAAAQLNSPHVIPIHHYGEIDGRLYVDMRLIEGRDLQTLLAEGPLEPARAVGIIDGVALALHAAHQVGLLHRDVKPSNILLDGNDFAYLIDFGIARVLDGTRMTKSGNTIGTFQYIAPERLGTRNAEDARADIYSLTCVLYECLAGSPPFPGETMARLVAAHLNSPPPRPSIARPDVPVQVDQVIATGMAKDPDQRYATTVELAHAAHHAIAAPIVIPAQNHGTRAAFVASSAAPTLPSRDAAARQPGTDLHLDMAQRAPRWWPPRGRAGLVAAIIVAVVALVSGVIVFQLERPSPPPAPSAAPTTRVAPPPTPPPSSPKPVGEAGLNGLLLTPDQGNTAMGATGMTAARAGTVLDDNSAVADLACRPLAGPLAATAYAGSGWTALREQVLYQYDPSNRNTHHLDQGVVLFPSAQDANTFFTASAQQWPACSNRQYTDTVSGEVYTVGPVSNTDGILTATTTLQNGKGWTCQRALTVANNVVVDVVACSYTQSSAGVNVARQIAGKVPTG